MPCAHLVQLHVLFQASHCSRVLQYSRALVLKHIMEHFSTRNLNQSQWFAIYFILICEPYRVKIGPFRSPSPAEVSLLRRLPMAQFSLLSRLPPLSEIHRVLQGRVNIRCGDRERAGSTLGPSSAHVCYQSAAAACSTVSSLKTGKTNRRKIGKCVLQWEQRLFPQNQWQASPTSDYCCQMLVAL